ncbi:hypothetical protein [Saccharothrix syringae]|uniref:Uncharacterized protein n=1 Tax=Saccharothrix syringae TaxID=103733 RepID=A0A5Q0H7L3_SACSY|nr:hypothetical protein [Saccharothrix syringae]QFZ22207.1 hypothetical protein EKG83_36620 [Saccharothrix syringae]
MLLVSSRSAVTVTRYLDAVLEHLRDAGVVVARVEVDLSPGEPFEARLVTERGAVLRWHEERGWHTTAEQSADPVEPDPR